MKHGLILFQLYTIQDLKDYSENGKEVPTNPVIPTIRKALLSKRGLFLF